MKSITLQNYFIGFVAGLCAALFPKLTATEVVNALYALASQGEAQSKVGALRCQVPDTSVVRAEDGSYLVIAKPASAPRSCAVLDAISLKKRLCGRATFEFLVAQ